MKKVSTLLKSLALGIVLASALTGTAFAETVYFRGQRVSWDHGRKFFVISYSEIQTHQFEHCATANTTWSG